MLPGCQSAIVDASGSHAISRPLPSGDAAVPDTGSSARIAQDRLARADTGDRKRAGSVAAPAAGIPSAANGSHVKAAALARSSTANTPRPSPDSTGSKRSAPGSGASSSSRSPRRTTSLQWPASGWRRLQASVPSSATVACALHWPSSTSTSRPPSQPARARSRRPSACGRSTRNPLPLHPRPSIHGPARRAPGMPGRSAASDTTSMRTSSPSGGSGSPIRVPRGGAPEASTAAREPSGLTRGSTPPPQGTRATGSTSALRTGGDAGRSPTTDTRPPPAGSEAKLSRSVDETRSCAHAPSNDARATMAVALAVRDGVIARRPLTGRCGAGRVRAAPRRERGPREPAQAGRAPAGAPVRARSASAARRGRHPRTRPRPRCCGP